MDANECETVIAAGRGAAGLSSEQILLNLDRAAEQFGKNAQARFKRGGEWAGQRGAPPARQGGRRWPSDSSLGDVFAVDQH